MKAQAVGTLNGPIFVEFIGLPGSGKSTLSRRVAQALRGRGVAVTEATYWLDHVVHKHVRQFVKVFLALSNVLTNPRLTLYCLDDIRRTRQRTALDFLMTFLNFTYVSQTIKILSRIPGVHLLDQGLFQAMWSIGYSSSVGESVLELCGRTLRLALPARLVTVVVHASMDTVAERLAMRATRGSRLERLVGYGDFASGLGRGADLVASIEDFVARLSSEAGAVKLVRVRNDSGHGAVDDCARKIVQVVWESCSIDALHGRQWRGGA